MRGYLAVLKRELFILRHRLYKTLLSLAVSPTLFLIAFGWGLGRSLDVEGVSYLLFMIPGLVAMSSMTQSFGIAVDINVARFYWNIFEEFQAAPVSDLSIAAAEVTYGILKGFLSAAVILLLSVALGTYIHINAGFVAALFANCFCFASLAFIVAMVVKSHADQAVIANFVITPMAFLCGTFFSLKALPAWAFHIINVLPLSQSTKALRAAALGQQYPMISLVYTMCLGVIFFVMAVFMVRRSRQ
jgi:ABC-2 type transport system permease protein